MTTQFRHPEQKPGEVFLMNVRLREGESEPKVFRHLSLTTKRLGAVAHNTMGPRKPFPPEYGMRPVFVKAAELDRLGIAHDGSEVSFQNFCDAGRKILGIAPAV